MFFTHFSLWNLGSLGKIAAYELISHQSTTLMVHELICIPSMNENDYYIMMHSVLATHVSLFTCSFGF